MKKFILGFVLCFGIFLSLDVQAQRVLDYDFSVQNFDIKNVPKNAVRVPLMNINIKAKKNISLSEILLKRVGLSSREDFGNIWAESSRYKTSLRAKVLLNDEVRIRFLRPVNILKNTEENFIIYMNLNSDGGGKTFKFVLEKFFINKIFNQKNYPKKGYSRSGYDFFKNRRRNTSYYTSNLSRNNNLSIRNFENSKLIFTPLGISNRLRIGSTSEVGKFRLQNSGRKDIKLKSIKFRNYGKSNLRTDFKDWKLVRNGEILAAGGRVDRDFIIFDLEDFILEGGDSMIVKVEAQLIYGRRKNTVQLGVQYPSDIAAEILNTNFNASIKVESKKLKSHELGVGDFNFIEAYRNKRTFNYNIPRKNSNIQNRNYSATNRISENFVPGSKNVVFLNRYFSTKYDFRAEGIFIPINSRTNISDKNNNNIKNEKEDLEATFNNLKLYLNNRVIDSTNNFSVVKGRLGILFDTDFVAGSRDNIKVTGRILNQAQNGDKLILDVSYIQLLESAAVFR